jgi:two-component system, sensor histidine kinase and response regulator
MISLVVERKKLLESLDNDPRMLTELIGTLLADCPETLAELRIAVTARNSKQIANSSHALRGSLSIFGAKTAFDAACALESMGRQG